MYEFNLLKHIEDSVIVTDKSNVWQNSKILDIPVYTPNSISIPGGVNIYGAIEDFKYVIHREIDHILYFLYGLDAKGRYTFLDMGYEYTHFSYKFGGRKFPQARKEPAMRYIDDILYVSGGVLNNDPMDDYWSYKFSTKTWSLLRSLPSPRWNHSILYNNGRIYLFGGSTRSRIDNRELILNDVFYIDDDMRGNWTLLDREATLPHTIGSLLGDDGVFLYLWIDKRVWSVALTGEQTSGSINTYDIGEYIVDVVVKNDGSYLLVKDKLDDPLGNIYRWTQPYNFELIKENQLCISDNPTIQDITINTLTKDIEVDNITYGGIKPPKKSSSISYCKMDGIDVYYRSNIFYIFRYDSFNTIQYELSENTIIPTQGHITADIHNNIVYIIGWSTDKKYILVGKFDLSDHIYELIYSSDEIHFRSDPSIELVQNDIWLIGGHTAEKGFFKDQWRFNINELKWQQEITLEPLPSQPFSIFSWRDRMWLIPRKFDSLYRYYPSTRQWTKIYISRDDTERQNMGLYDYDVNYDIVDNRLFIEPNGYSKIVIELESKTAISPLYRSNIWTALDRAHVLCTDDRLYISDGTRMRTTIADQPPYFENSAHSSKGLSLIDSHPYIIHGYNDIGEWKPAYGDTVGLFWINTQEVKWNNFDEQKGFYIPETDYKGDYGDTYRRLPTMEYRPRDSKPLYNAITDISLFNSRFIANFKELIRYRTEDGTFFSYNAPISEGSAVGYSDDGRVYIFGGRNTDNILNLQQNGLYFQTSISSEDEEDEESTGKAHIECKPTLVIYDLNYAQGEIEYLAEIPDFYERHDYDVAADYLISRYNQIISPDDTVNKDRALDLHENYYSTTQSIIDDIAVRYVTYEDGARPSARSWSITCQVENKLYVGGGALEIKPPPAGDCPPLWTYESKNLNYDDPDLEEDPEAPGYIDPGNLVDNQLLDDFYVLDMTSESWTQLANAPWTSLFHGSAAITPDRKEIWVVGGYKDGSLLSRSADIFIYDIGRNSWRTFGNVPDGYLGRAKPALSWIDEDTLMIMYGTICTITKCGDCPCYWFNTLGDSWIIHRPTQVMYKNDSDLPKTFTIMPSDNNEPYVDLLYIPDESPSPGGQSDIVTTLAMSKLYSEDWTAYEEKYNYTLRYIYEQLVEKYSGEVYVDIEGNETIIDIPDFDGGNSVTYIYNQILPDLDPRMMYDEYRSVVNNPGDRTLLKDTVVILYYIEANKQDFTASLLSELALRADQTILGLSQYELIIRDIFIALDRITGTMYPANRITPEDLLLVRKSMLTGEYTRVQKVVQSKTVQFDLEGIKDIFRYQNKDWWLVGWFLQKGSTDPEDSFLRFYRFANRPDGDIDLTELPVDLPIGMEPFALGYDNKYSIICLFNKFNIWRLDLDKAINNPNNEYWQRLPPALNYGNFFNHDLRYLMQDNGIMLFFDAYGLVLSYDLDNIVWDMVRATIDKTNKDSYVVVDNTELYYIGGSTGYFDTDTLQGDRFIINSDICELGIGTPVVPRLSVQRNLVIGFDINNNMVSAFVRKRGTFDKSWAFPNYFYVEKILISVDYDSLDYTEEMEIYIKTDKGVSRFPTYTIKATEPWSFNEFIRMYENDQTRTHTPNQYLAADVYDYVAEFQIFFQPPIKDYGYISRVNEVFVVPKRSEKFSATDYYVACENEITIGINNPLEGRKYLIATTDDKDLTMSWNKQEYSYKIDAPISPRTQSLLYLKALHNGKVAHIMVVNDKTKE